MSNTLELMETDVIPDDKGLSVYCTKSFQDRTIFPICTSEFNFSSFGVPSFQGHDSDVLNMSAPVAQNFVQPGSSVPIYIDNSDTLLIPDRRRSQFGCFSSESGDCHTSLYESDNVEKASKSGSGSSFVVPVVYEVSLQQQSKLIRVYSTVIILNSTSMPLELRFDIPFGISPKILDPIFPGQEFPLPLHLAKSGRLRWRPLGDSYLWSEAHSISKVLSQDSRIGFRRSFAYGNFGQQLHDLDQSRERFIHQVTLSTPFVVRQLSSRTNITSIESGGITQTASLPESTRQVPFAAYPKDSPIVRKRSLSSKSLREVCFQGNESGKVKACIYSPCPISRASDTMIRVKRDLPEWDNSSSPYPLWSAPFPLVPPSGSTNVIVPQPSPGESALLSVTCSILGGALAGRTQAITFQPRYVICNSCSHNLCYKQKGTNLVSHLAVGQHCQLQWTDTARELLVSIRLNEPGWQWSGSFLPDHLGDTQLKIWNYVNKAFNMVRVEVQNANMSSGDEKIVGSVHGHVGTNFILLSDDDMGYMPYRIDNFSNERLRVYQQKCETFDTIVHPYTSCPYAWDEPCYPHRLTIEVPGDRVIGSYAFEITKQPIAVHLRSTSEKPERTLLLSICAEGATKV
ncbi:unnamed protein product [Arabidopsis arenosa]|uniref:Vacuolar protein sorting-associated protein 13 VPS13 adaptor binding domain-containing protein n=1 Tax=Arabidopsis arenosa TaxID=38785 RepID=A0A8S2AJY6_ARAAE|nr:unnamed protein product [Arabidopsis arenosa]